MGHIFSPSTICGLLRYRSNVYVISKLLSQMDRVCVCVLCCVYCIMALEQYTFC